MWLLSSTLLLVVFPAGIVAVGVLTRGHSHYTTLICGASTMQVSQCSTIVPIVFFPSGSDKQLGQLFCHLRPTLMENSC